MHLVALGLGAGAAGGAPFYVQCRERALPNESAVVAAERRKRLADFVHPVGWFVFGDTMLALADPQAEHSLRTYSSWDPAHHVHCDTQVA